MMPWNQDRSGGAGIDPHFGNRHRRRPWDNPDGEWGEGEDRGPRKAVPDSGRLIYYGFHLNQGEPPMRAGREYDGWHLAKNQQQPNMQPCFGFSQIIGCYQPGGAASWSLVLSPYSGLRW